MTIRNEARRRFLLRAGALVTTLPFLRGVIPRASAAVARPRRLILLMESNGTLVDRWRPVGNETNFTFPADSILAPLERHKGNLVLAEPMKIHHGFGDQHFRGYTALWTGVSAVGTNRGSPTPGGKSVDQHVAETVSAGRKHATLNLGVIGGRTGSRNCFARASGQPIGPDNDPYAVYRRVFEGLTAGVPGAERDRLVAEERSVLDVVAGDLGALSRRLGGAERAKLDAHLAAVRALEGSLSAGVSAACKPAAAPTGKLSIINGGNFQAIERMMTDMIVAALSCDLTRVCTLEWGASNNGQVYGWLGHTRDHHGLSHAVAVEELVQINQWLAGRVANLMDMLAAIPEDGGSMLDNTLIVWGNELGVGGPHKETDFPVLMAGGKNLGMRVGRHLALTGMPPTNHLLVTICRAMGLPDEAYGDAQVARGPIPGAIG